jgi:hypothetical protein
MELALMVASAVAGFFRVHWGFALLVGLLLTIINSGKSLAFARENSDIGSMRVLALSFGTMTLNNMVFAVMSFGAGRAFSWLIVG